MTDKALSLCRNDVLGGGMMSTQQNTSGAIRKNLDVTNSFRVLGGPSGINSNEYIYINGWDDSNNTSFENYRGENLFSATTKSSGIWMKRGGVKYGRQWGCQIGYKNVPSSSTEYAFLPGVCGLEFDWEFYTADKNHSYVRNLILIYGSTYSTVYCMPLISGDNTLYPGATKNYSGDNLLGINGNDKKGRICIRGSETMCNIVHNRNLIFLGLAIGFKQLGNQGMGETQEFRMWNCRPMFSRDGISSSYRAICPGKKYPYGQAADGYMAIA